MHVTNDTGHNNLHVPGCEPRARGGAGSFSSASSANPRDELLRSVRALCPRVMTLVQQELNTNTKPHSRTQRLGGT